MATPAMGKVPDDSTVQSAEQPACAPSFEQTLGRLEEIVHLLEEGKIGLDDALARYEEGVGLLRTANDLLTNAERRISMLSGFDPEGNPVLRPMEDAASFSLEREFVATVITGGPGEKVSGRRGRKRAESETP